LEFLKFLPLYNSHKDFSFSFHLLFAKQKKKEKDSLGGIAPIPKL
jgi:hypothetical protein